MSDAWFPYVLTTVKGQIVLSGGLALPENPASPSLQPPTPDREITWNSDPPVHDLGGNPPEAIAAGGNALVLMANYVAPRPTQSAVQLIAQDLTQNSSMTVTINGDGSVDFESQGGVASSSGIMWLIDSLLRSSFPQLAPPAPRLHLIGPPARKYRAAAQAIPAATWTKVGLDTVTFDIGGNSFVGADYHVSHDGIYLVMGAVGLVTGASSQIASAIWKNSVVGGAGGLEGAQAVGSTTTQAQLPVAGLMQCVQNDTISLWVYTASALNLTLADYINVLSVMQIA